MTRASYAATAARLFHDFLAPLVIGGAATPGPAIGPRAALSLGDPRASLDPFQRTLVELSRVRVARRLVAIDVLDAPTPDEWALAAALHDLVFALHPGLDTLLHRRAPAKLLEGAAAILDHVAPAPSLAAVVSRHTLFARTLELQRTDTTVSWWVGSRRFLGAEPPTRLLAWPELRQVRTERSLHTLMDLPALAGSIDRERCQDVLQSFLRRLPLTDLATAARSAPAFLWSDETLGLLLTRGGRSLGLRALDLGARARVDAALGRATRALVESGAMDAATHAASVLADRAMAWAVADLRAEPIELENSADAAYAMTLGAVMASRRPERDLVMSQELAARTKARLEPYLRSELGRQLAAGHFFAILGNAAGSAGGSSTSIEP